MKTPRKVVVSKKLSEQQIVDAARWKAFIKASGTSYENITEEWWAFFEAQSDPASASTQLVRLIDLAILKDEAK